MVHTATWMTLKSIMLCSRSQAQQATHNHSIYMTFLQRQNSRDREQASAGQGLGVEGGADYKVVSDNVLGVIEILYILIVMASLCLSKLIKLFTKKRILKRKRERAN